MVQSETLIVFRILRILAEARDLGHPLPLEAIANAARLGRSYAAHYLSLLEQAHAVCAQTTVHPPTYALTRYGLERLVGIASR